MRGMGKQKLVAGMNFVGFWVVGLTLGASLAFGAHVGVAGLWWGLLCGLTFTAILLVTMLLRTDWEAEVRRAQRNLGAASAASPEVGVKVVALRDLNAVASDVTVDPVGTKEDGFRAPHIVS